MGVTTFIILSAISANLLMFISSAEARIICTLDRSNCKNSSRRSDMSIGFLSPSSCCILRSNWVGLRSPSSSAVRSCRIFWRSESAIREISFQFLVGIFLGWVNEEIPDFRGIIQEQGTDCFLIFGFRGCNAPSGELHLYLYKPDLGIGWPKGR